MFLNSGDQKNWVTNIKISKIMLKLLEIKGEHEGYKFLDILFEKITL